MRWDGVEKRRFVRANFPCKIEVHTPEEISIHSHTENIGEGGVRVIIEKKIDMASMVDLQIYMGKEAVGCKGKVVWVVEKVNPIDKKAMFFDTGIEFHDINDSDRKLIGNLVETIISGQK